MGTALRGAQNYVRKFWRRLAAALGTWRVPVANSADLAFWPDPESILHRLKIGAASFLDVSEEIAELTNDPSVELNVTAKHGKQCYARYRNFR